MSAPAETGSETAATLKGLRVAIVTPTVERVGGTEVYIKRLSTILKTHGAECTFFTQQAHSDDPRVQALGDTLSESLSRSKARKRRAAVTELAGRIAAKADIVECHRLAPPDLLRALSGRVKIIVSVHTSDMMCPAGSRYLPRSGGLCGAKPGPGCLLTHVSEGCLSGLDGEPLPLKQRLRSLFRTRLSRGTADQADAMIFNSAAARGLFEEVVGRKVNGHVLHPPLTATGVPDDIPRNPSRLLYVGRLERFKGVMDAIDVTARLPGRELHVYGHGTLENQARQYAKTLSVAERVQFHGWRGGDEVALAAATSGCLLVPTRGFECWGLSGPEAIAAGCPVVGYNSGGIGEWCREPFGALVPVGDIAAMAAAAEQWRERLSSGLETSGWRQRALDLWCEERFSRKYATIIASLLPGRVSG